MNEPYPIGTRLVRPVGQLHADLGTPYHYGLVADLNDSTYTIHWCRSDRNSHHGVEFLPITTLRYYRPIREENS